MGIPSFLLSLALNRIVQSADLVTTWAFLEEGVNHIMSRLETGVSYSKVGPALVLVNVIIMIAELSLVYVAIYCGVQLLYEFEQGRTGIRW